MAQATRVLKLSPKQGAKLERRLSAEEFEFRSVPHAVFSAKGPAVVATLYTSGKLVIQGENPEAFVAQYLDAIAPMPDPVRGDSQQRAPGIATAKVGDEGMIGSDESGKGDFFGPLVVAAVRLEPGESQSLAGGPVRDSKLLSDETCLRLGAALRGKFAHAIARLDPPQYNARHAQLKNLNPMLAELHAQAIRELARPGIYVLVDQFANEKVLLRAIEGLDIRLEQRPRAEEVPAVAAASVIAREQFLLALRALSELYAVDLCKGAGESTDRAAGRFVALHGLEKLRAVSKVHFKNTSKLQIRGRA